MHDNCVYVFDSSTANEAAIAVRDGLYSSIISYHEDHNANHFQQNQQNSNSRNIPPNQNQQLMNYEDHHHHQEPIQDCQPTNRKRRQQDQKKSAYTIFFTEKKKELFNNLKDFSEASKEIAGLWHNLSHEEKSRYTQDVRKKRKELLKKKASEQAQNLLI